MELRRVVVTGLGGVSPFGIGIKKMMDGLYDGKSAVVSQKHQWETHLNDLNCWVGAPLSEELPTKSIPRALRKTMGPTAMMALLASQEAIKDAALPEADFGIGRTGVAFASSIGSIESWTRYLNEYIANASLKGTTSCSFFQVMSHTCAANIAHSLGIKGRVISPDCACSSSTQAIGLGYETIKYGLQDAMLCGGADELSAIVCGSFDMLNATSYKYNDEPSKTPRPFDADRDGTVCGEGGGCIVLESEERALERGVPILAEVIGFSTSSNGTHLTQPHSDSIEECMKTALKSANLTVGDIDYINAHATATLIGDAVEAGAIRSLFGERTLPVSSFKGHMGHTLGASGALELAASILMMKSGKIIPNLNFTAAGEGCEGLDYVDSLRQADIEIFMKNSFAFGGINSVLILKRYGVINEQ